MKKAEKDQYFVAVKLFLTDKNGRLFISKDRFGDWDLPGGRLRTNDFGVPMEKVLRRKIKEELGSSLVIKLTNEPVIFMRHERQEVLPDGTREKRRIFAVGYVAKYLGGKIKLGGNHVLLKWEKPGTFKPEKYFYGGWLKGVNEYLARKS